MDSSPACPGAAAAPAIVVGGGISGLLSARELSAAGHAVTVLEASDRWGGCVASHTLAGLTLDSGAESFATRTDAVSGLIADLGLAGSIVAPRPGGAWVQLPEGPRELPRTGVLGIPANPWDPEVRRSLGLAGSLRASLDRFLPASIGGAAEVTSVSGLVRKRMGSRVLDRLVSPVVGGVHSADPGMLDVDMVAPGLRAGLRKHGSLAAAVSALVADLRARGVRLLPGTAASKVARTADGWRVTAGEETYDAGLLVVAVEGPAAVGLLEGAVPGISGSAPLSGPDVRLVTLVLDKPELDARPRGTGVLVAPQTPGVEAKALTHATGKWDWLAAAAGPGRHVVRLSYGRVDGLGLQGGGPATEEDLLGAALRDAASLLGVPMSRDDLVDWDVVRWQGSLPFAAVGHRARVAGIRGACAAAGGMALVGGWVAGNGLAAVVADTREQIRRLAA